MEKIRLVFLVLTVLLVCHQAVDSLDYGYRPRIRTKFGLNDPSGDDLEARDDLKNLNDEYVVEDDDFM